MRFIAFLFFAYGLFCIILAISQLRYFYKNKSDKKFITLKKYTKSMVSLFLITSVLSISLSLLMFFKSFSITIASECFILILSYYTFTLGRINKKYGLSKNK